MRDSDITEFEYLDPDRLDGVSSPANGVSFLLLKSGAPEASEDCGEDCEGCAHCMAPPAVKFVSAAARRKMSQSGVAMPDGAFPIADKGHLISAIGRLAEYGGDKVAAKRHIIARARALGLTRRLPKDWHIRKGLPSEAEAQDERDPSVESFMDQTRAMHPGAGPRDMDTGHDAGRPPAGPYRQPRPPKADGMGDTSPTKGIPLGEAEGQTRELTRKGEDPAQARVDSRVHDVDTTGDTAPDKTLPEGEAERQTRAETRDGSDATTTDQRRRQNAQSQKGKGKDRAIQTDNPNTHPGDAAWEGKDVALADSAVQALSHALRLVQEFEAREKQEARKSILADSHSAIRRAAELLAGLVGTRSTGPASKEIEDMTQDELLALLAARDRAATKAAKAAAKKKTAKAAKKAARAAKVVAKGAPASEATTADPTPKKVAKLQARISNLTKRLETVENQPARPAAMLNEAGIAGASIRRGADGASAFKALEDKLAEAQTPQERQRLGMELLTAKMIAAERTRQAQPGPAGGPTSLLAAS